MGHSIDTPTGLVCMQDARFANLLFELLLIGFKQLCKVGPGLGQTTGADFECVANREQACDIADTHAQEIMQPGAIYHDVQAKGGAGQGIGHNRGDDFFAVVTPGALDEMQIDFRCHRWDIFDDALMLTTGIPNRMTTIRTCFQTVEMRCIDVIGDGAALTGMALFSSRFTVPFAPGRFQIRWCRPDGCVGDGSSLLLPLAWDCSHNAALFANARIALMACSCGRVSSASASSCVMILRLAQQDLTPAPVQWVEPHILGLLMGMITVAPFAMAAGLPDQLPISGPVTGAGKTAWVYKGLGQHR